MSRPDRKDQLDRKDRPGRKGRMARRVRREKKVLQDPQGRRDRSDPLGQPEAVLAQVPLKPVPRTPEQDSWS